ncbi:MAG: DsbA family oxidoreductase [Hyphomicrobiales bacterium]|nr:DsbA family oxidoreductase [Hyphomicrobiales bacterium]
MTEQDPIQIDVVSDVMCPWCFIGKRRLEQAIDLLPDVPLDIRWRPFQLDATIPAEGIPRQDYLERKFGTPEQIAAIYDAVEEAGRAEGIPFAFGRIERSPNTLNAHRLIRWAVKGGVQDILVERLFTLFFVDGADIGDHAVLVEAAVEVGMRGDLVAELLESDADVELTRKEIAIAQHMGISGVPCFIIDNRYAVVGAQSPTIIAEAIEKAASEKLAGTPVG